MKQAHWFTQSIQVGLMSLAMGAGATFNNSTALAQVTADPSLGTAIIDVISPTGTGYGIIGGTTVGGRNLFHSFSRFDVRQGEGAVFLHAPAIANIFARITGNTPSIIDGSIATAILQLPFDPSNRGTANVFLMNPQGIIFGRGAQLNIGGSFVATTANAIRFPDGAEFSLTSAVEPTNSLLSVNPSAFLFNQIQAAPIINRSIANAGRDPSNSFGVFGLRVPDGRSLLMVGGDINTDGGGIVAFGGRIDVGGVQGSGTVDLNQNGNVLRLQFPENVSRANVLNRNGSNLIVAADSGGNIAITAQNIGY